MRWEEAVALSGKAIDALLRLPDSHWRGVSPGCVPAWPKRSSFTSARFQAASGTGRAAGHTPAHQAPGCQGNRGASANHDARSDADAHADHDADRNGNTSADRYA